MEACVIKLYTMKKAEWNTVKAIYALPYRIMQLEKDIQEKCNEIKDMRNRLSRLKLKVSNSPQ